ncbi:MAG: anticodon nuclease, partial [Candidatus Omnitrophica bacterium]|nr:anticodon nuclease [Candidatus Omnitrophota bacterium]
YNSKGFILSKKDNRLELESQDDSPFGYHLIVKEEIEKAITTNDVKRYHFNLFRSLLEKTANFLGYTKWYHCVPKKNREEINRLINLYSHGKLSEMESKDVPDEHKVLFKETFNTFTKDFKWKVAE